MPFYRIIEDLVNSKQSCSKNQNKQILAKHDILSNNIKNLISILIAFFFGYNRFKGIALQHKTNNYDNKTYKNPLYNKNDDSGLYPKGIADI